MQNKFAEYINTVHPVDTSDTCFPWNVRPSASKMPLGGVVTNCDITTLLWQAKKCRLVIFIFGRFVEITVSVIWTIINEHLLVRVEECQTLPKSKRLEFVHVCCVNTNNIYPNNCKGMHGHWADSCLRRIECHPGMTYTALGKIMFLLGEGTTVFTTYTGFDNFVHQCPAQSQTLKSIKHKNSNGQ